MDLKEYCKNLPKVELHAHLNGSISPETFKKLGSTLESIQEYQKVVSIVDVKDQSLENVFILFSVAHKLTSNKENLYEVTRSVINDFYKDNVIYLDLRTTPRATDHMTMDEYIETVIRAIKDNDNGILVKLLLSIDRAKGDDKEIDKTVETILKFKSKYPDIVKGVDFSGNPHLGKFNPAIFERFRKNGLKTTIHVGEIKNNEEFREILQFKPDRLGHATTLHPNYGGCEDNWELYKTLKIPIECCLTSNILSGTSKDYKGHHLKEWIKNNLPFCLGTDDKGVFNTDLTTEYYIAATNFNLNNKQLWDISYNSIKYSFASNEEKENLITKLKKYQEK